MNENNIKLYSTNSELKASVVERFNRTLKEKMWRYFTYSNNFKYLDVLEQLVESYNNTYHRTIKTKPLMVTKINEDQKKRINFFFFNTLVFQLVTFFFF